MNQEDAMRRLLDWIRKGSPVRSSNYGYEVYIPDWIAQQTSDVGKQRELSVAIFDAAWELCRRGILRPGVKEVTGPSVVCAGGAGYSLTPFGRQWLKEPDHAFVPTEPDRFAKLIEPFRSRFGPGYFDRAQQAIRCYAAHAHMASCAMCGAAAESVLLATAIAKWKGDEKAVLETYRTANGRSRLEKRVIGAVSDILKEEFLGLTGLLKYWRDEAAHGRASQIADNEAYTSLVMLLRYSMFIDENWAEFTK